MTKLDAKLERLLRSAASAREDLPAEMPFGFGTRVVALSSLNNGSDSNGLARLAWRVGLIAIAVTLLAGAGAYREMNQSEELGEPFANEYAIADSAIQNAVSQ
jgi:hypothetical protein